MLQVRKRNALYQYVMHRLYDAGLFISNIVLCGRTRVYF